MSDTCRSCGAQIIWASSRATGKPMPLDAKATKGIVLDPEPGHRTPTATVVDVFTSHFATCPDAAQHRGMRR